MQTSKQKRRARLAAMQGTSDVFNYVDDMRHARHATTKQETPPKRFARGDDIDATAEQWAAPRLNTEKRTEYIINTRQSYHGGAHRLISVDGKGPTPTP